MASLLGAVVRHLHLCLHFVETVLAFTITFLFLPNYYFSNCILQHFILTVMKLYHDLIITLLYYIHFVILLAKKCFAFVDGCTFLLRIIYYNILAFSKVSA